MKQLFIICFLLLASSLTAVAQFTNSGNIKLAPGAAITFFGNVANNGTVIDSATLVTLAGSATQVISGSSVTTFNNLTVNNSSAVGITLSQAMNVRGILVLTDGYVNTTTANILGMTATATVTGTSNNCFVSGPMFKTGNQAFIFPVGKNLVYAPIAISAPGTLTDRFTAEYFKVSPNALYNVNSREAGLNHVSQCEYWILDRTTGTSNVTVNLSWAARSCGITNPADLRVARWDGTQWTNKGNGGTTGTTAAGTIVSSAPVTAFSPFTLGSVSSDNPLPVELVDFAVQCEDNTALLTWNTLSELNNDYFTIESSPDAKEWTAVDLVDGTGTSTTAIAYSYTDLSSVGRDNYYRLKQTDMDGISTYHEVLFLESCLNSPENEITVYPNPSKGLVKISSMETILAVAVYNSTGQQLNNTEVNLQDKSVNFQQVPEGIYFIEITTSEKIINRRISIGGR